MRKYNILTLKQASQITNSFDKLRKKLSDRKTGKR